MLQHISVGGPAITTKKQSHTIRLPELNVGLHK